MSHAHVYWIVCFLARSIIRKWKNNSPAEIGHLHTPHAVSLSNTLQLKNRKPYPFRPCIKTRFLHLASIQTGTLLYTTFLNLARASSFFSQTGLTRVQLHKGPSPPSNPCQPALLVYNRTSYNERWHGSKARGRTAC
jgi:hypothetical protein